MAGPIALVGSGEFLPSMAAVDRELLDGRARRAVILPTAAAPEGDERVDHWVRLGVEHYRSLEVDAVALRVLDRAGALDASVAAQVDGAGLVYLSGGNPGYLAETLRDTPVWAAIRGAWERGAALAGCSAGAAALTALAHDVAEPGFPARSGLGLLDHIVCISHFDRIEEWAPGIVRRVLREAPAGATVVGVDEDTALVGGPERWTVRGMRFAWVLGENGDRARFEPGAVVETPIR